MTIFSSHGLDVDARLKRFRVASRELFNQYFRIDPPYPTSTFGNEQLELFTDLEEFLFSTMVAKPLNILQCRYGSPINEIAVSLKSDCAKALFNREIDSGYWDYPVSEVTSDAQLIFVTFLDWDSYDYRDYQFVEAELKQWTAHPEMVNKRVLLDSGIVNFKLA